MAMLTMTTMKGIKDTLLALWLPSHVIQVTIEMDPTQQLVSPLELGIDTIHIVTKVMHDHSF